MGIYASDSGIIRASSREVIDVRPEPLVEKKAFDVIKRLGDIVFALIATILLAPLIVCVAALVFFFEGRPILYGHERIGRNGRRFKCYKFRTMHRNSDALLKHILETNPAAKAEWEESRKLRDDPRVSTLGNILRKTSLDELPQLYNIFRGDMSTVGPRPIVKDELEYYGDAASHYLSVRPGLTGLWQVSGRSDTDYGQRVALDTSYVRHRGLLLDLKILLKTVRVVLARTGSC